MKIIDLIIQPFNEIFKLPLKTANHQIINRSGFIIKIISDQGEGYGESSPLLGFSNETLKEVSYALESYRLAVTGLEESCSDELISLVSIHSNGLPSVEFGLETAIYDMISKIDNKSFSQYLNKNSYKTLKSNGIVGIHGPEENFRVMKVKVGNRNLFDELNNLSFLTEEFGEDIKFRLDANGSMDLVRAIRLCKEIEKYNIDYFEQPLPKEALEDLAELRNHTSIPIAVDESLTNINSAENILEFQAADVFIVKPMLTGRYHDMKNILELSRSNDVRSVITSTIESNIGLSACVHIASSLLINEVCGFSTYSLFKKKQELPFDFNNGVITLTNSYGLGFKNNVI